MSLSSKKNENFVSLASGGFNIGFSPKPKTRRTLAEFKKVVPLCLNLNKVKFLQR